MDLKQQILHYYRVDELSLREYLAGLELTVRRSHV